MGVFGIIGLLSGSMGVYSTMAFVVARQTPGIGVRLALGASKSRIVRLVWPPRPTSTRQVRVQRARSLWQAGRQANSVIAEFDALSVRPYSSGARETADSPGPQSPTPR